MNNNSNSTKTVSIATLYERLASHGFSKECIWDNFLPDWWCEEYEQECERGATVELAVYVFRKTGLDYKSLLNKNAP